MKLPYLEKIFVPEAKIVEYLLNPEHNEGRGKAIFFTHFGFSITKWEQLAKALIQHAQQHEVVKIENTPFGNRYIIEGRLFTPSGRIPNVRVVWFIDTGKDFPRLVTAYPLETDND